MLWTLIYAPPSQLGVRRTRIHVDAQEETLARLGMARVADTPGGGTTYWVDAVTRAVVQSDVREGDAVITFGAELEPNRVAAAIATGGQ